MAHAYQSPPGVYLRPNSPVADKITVIKSKPWWGSVLGFSKSKKKPTSVSLSLNDERINGHRFSKGRRIIKFKLPYSHPSSPEL